MQFSKYCKRNEVTIVKRQKHSRNNDVDSLELPLREVKLGDNKLDEDFFFFSSSDFKYCGYGEPGIYMSTFRNDWGS